MASTDSRPIPIKNTAYRVVFPILDADGDLVTGATGLDSEVSKDMGTFADCTNEATEIATSSGVYYLDLTSTEMNADSVAVIVKTSSTGAKTTVLTLYPQEADDIRVAVTYYGTSAGTFSGGRPEVNATHVAGTSLTATGAIPELGIVRRCTAASATSTSVTLDASAAFATDGLKGMTALVYGSTQGYWQSRSVLSNTNAAGANVITVDAFTTTPTGTITVLLLGTAPATATAASTPLVRLADTTHGGGSTTITAALTGNITGNLSGSVGSVTGAVGSVTGNVGGNVTGSVGSVASGGIASASFATAALNAIADALLGRNIAGGSSTGRTVTQALRKLRNRIAFSGGTLTVYAEDDSTTSHQETVTGTPTVTQTDPTT